MKMKNKIELSIIIPIYNVEKYLEECLLSVYAIKDISIEVILVNDGSVDKSIDIINKFLLDYEDITLFINQANQGQSAARNAGLENATGEYVMFVDSDDLVDPEKLQELVKYAIDENLDLVQALGEKFDCEDDVSLAFHPSMFSLPVSSGRDYLKAYCDCSSIENRDYRPEVWLLCIKRIVLISNKIQFTEGMNYEDELIVPTIILCCNRIKALNCLFYFYRTRSDSIMTTFTEFHLESKAKLVNHYFSMLKFHKFYHYFLNCRIIGWSAEGLNYISFRQLFAIFSLKKLKIKDSVFLITLILRKCLLVLRK